MRNNVLHYYNTSTAQHICGSWNDGVIKELHLNKNGLLFFAVYDAENHKSYIIPATISDALSFIEDSKSNKVLRWFPNGKSILEDVVNNNIIQNP